MGLATPAVLAGLSEELVGELTTRLAVVGEAVQGVTLAGLARVADSGLPQAQGAVTPASWWREITRSSAETARVQVRLARCLARHFAVTTTAWQGGDLRADHVTVIAGGVEAVLHRHARRIRRARQDAGRPIPAGELAGEVAGLRAALEATLIAAATPGVDPDGREILGATPEDLRALLAQARIMADPDGASEEEMARELDALLKIETVGDLAVLKAQLTVETAENLRTILDHHRALAFSRGAPAREGDPAPVDMEPDPVTGDPRLVTNAAKDAAALGDWIDATLDGGLGSRPVSERPHLDIAVTLADLLAGAGSAVLSRTGTPVPAATAQRHACDADVRVVITDGIYRDARTGAVLDPVVGALLLGAAGLLDYGRGHRIVPPRLRRALAHRDRGCAFPGCGRPPSHTQAHHIVYWEHGGETSLANTVLLCSRHHHYVHEGRWRITLRPGMGTHQCGCWQFSPPERPVRL